MNQPAQLAKVLRPSAGYSRPSTPRPPGQVSLADLIVLAGGVGSSRPRRAGVAIDRALHSGPDGCLPGPDPMWTPSRCSSPRRWISQRYAGSARASRETMLIDKAAARLVPRMTVLVGGMRVLGTNAGSCHGVFTTAAQVPLSSDFFVNLLDMGAGGSRRRAARGDYEGRDRQAAR